MVKKYYTCFGLQNRVLDVLLRTLNPTGMDIVDAQIRPYDGGTNPMFVTYGTVDALCDITWVSRADKDIYHPLKATPNTVAIIRSDQLRTILDGVPYRGNRIYCVCLNAAPLVYTDSETPYSRLIQDDVSGETLNPRIYEFVPAAVEEFDPAHMTKVFIQGDMTKAYDAATVRGWVDDGNVFVNLGGQYRKYCGGGEAFSTLTLAPGDLIRVKKDDTCLRPLDGSLPTEYSLTRSPTTSPAYYWSTLPSLAGWTTRTLLAYVKGGVEYPFVIEMEHVASGGFLVAASGYSHPGYYGDLLLPAWYYPIVFIQYPLGKAGYLGAVPSYVQE